MLFNSAGFLLLFLPVALILYHVLFARAERWRQPFLIALTILFYAIGGKKFVVLLLVSVAVNYAVARWIAARRRAGGSARWPLVVGIGFDLALLFYFKYFAAVIVGAGGLFGFDLPLRHIALPLGISFFTFQQIGFLVDLARGRFEMKRAIDYAGFVLFFPQLLAGPIVRYEELVPQLRARPSGAASTNILIGLTIFAIGLFKKVVIADTVATLAAPVFDAAATGATPGMAACWIAAFAYTAQIYFDFSGYSDMAIGTARMFGVVLPLNFHSPLRASSIIELWRRWHVTLSRWAQSYIFQPLTIPLARFSADHAAGKFASFLLSFALPILLSMVVIGVWHGAGWTFVLFGVLQGLYMTVNEYWRMTRRKARKARKGPPPFYVEPMYRALTLVAFVVAVVAFRAPSLAVVGRMYAAMIGLGGGVAAVAWPAGLAGTLALLAIVYAIVYLAPNTQEIMTRFEPVLEWAKWRKIDTPLLRVEWRLTPAATIASAVLLFLGFALMMRGTTNFIYFNF
ncbi:MBOAT family protein [Sphingomonas populi]|uniref:Probable alginate O-acetylase AlgI n=1 Tax=Sphingomonas populi TaxID=2484750 RepID=A0A4Q6Y415_9SPHN|nr:MBOAT family O-acyltransferase [Sphingomonas populi]RZF64129.1 MBOAT family protein [Sphingomonas populi]